MYIIQCSQILPSSIHALLKKKLNVYLNHYSVTLKYRHKFYQHFELWLMLIQSKKRD